MLRDQVFPADPRPPIALASQFLGRCRLDEAEREVMTAFSFFGRGCGEALFLLGMVRVMQNKLEEAL